MRFQGKTCLFQLFIHVTIIKTTRKHSCLITKKSQCLIAFDNNNDKKLQCYAAPKFQICSRSVQNEFHYNSNNQRHQVKDKFNSIKMDNLCQCQICNKTKHDQSKNLKYKHTYTHVLTCTYIFAQALFTVCTILYFFGHCDDDDDDDRLSYFHKRVRTAGIQVSRFSGLKAFSKVYKKKLPKVDTPCEQWNVFICLLISVPKDDNTKSNNALRNGQYHHTVVCMQHVPHIQLGLPAKILFH